MTEKKISKDAENKINQLTMMQQQLQMFAAQKQQFQLQLAEVETAIEELNGAKKAVYKLAGGILVEKNKEDLLSEQESNKSKLELRIKSIEKQENSIREKAMDLQKEISKDLK